MRWIGSPNFFGGREGKKVSFVVVHHAVGTLASTDSVFQNQQRNTSAHYCVGRNGEIHQYVDERNTAFHAGQWNANLQSVGIEHEDLAKDDFTDTQYETSAALIREICERHGLPINSSTVLPHRNFVATACPGDLDINRLINLANGEEMNTFTNPANGDTRDAQGWYNAYAERDDQWNHDERVVIPDLNKKLKTANDRTADLAEEAHKLREQLKLATSATPKTEEPQPNMGTTDLQDYSLGELLQAAFKKTFRIK